ncbi:tetratricopeptide repeat protein [Granulicella paludicola]|uniref:tetratricopeptide repeat protein n=1 Tax=Granulicella paludicola TaxID=474951 RepID=UPI0037BEEC50
MASRRQVRCSGHDRTNPCNRTAVPRNRRFQHAVFHEQFSQCLPGQGKDAQTEALYRQTLKIRRRVLGTKYPDTLTSMVQRRVLGSERPDVLLSASNLADTYSREGKFT